MLEISWQCIVWAVWPSGAAFPTAFSTGTELGFHSSFYSCPLVPWHNFDFYPEIMSLLLPEFLSLEMGFHQLMAFRRSRVRACPTLRGFLPYSHLSLTSVSVMLFFFSWKIDGCAELLCINISLCALREALNVHLWSINEANWIIKFSDRKRRRVHLSKWFGNDASRVRGGGAHLFFSVRCWSARVLFTSSSSRGTLAKLNFWLVQTTAGQNRLRLQIWLRAAFAAFHQSFFH